MIPRKVFAMAIAIRDFVRGYFEYELKFIPDHVWSTTFGGWL
jgi:hypothetical protein